MGSADQSREDFPVIIDLAARGRINLDHSVSHELSLEKSTGPEMLRRKEITRTDHDYTGKVNASRSYFSPPG